MQESCFRPELITSLVKILFVFRSFYSPVMFVDDILLRWRVSVRPCVRSCVLMSFYSFVCAWFYVRICVRVFLVS